MKSRKKAKAGRTGAAMKLAGEKGISESSAQSHVNAFGKGKKKKAK